MDKLKSWLKISMFVVPAAYLINFVYAIITYDTGGTFGDTFGAANALFSGTALLMLVYAVILQREELQVVKDERKDTQKLLSGQEDINRLQKTALDRQVFEQTFFSIVSTLSNEAISLDRIIERLSYKPTVLAEAVATINRQTPKAHGWTWTPEFLENLLSIETNQCLPFCQLAGVAFRLVQNSLVDDTAPKDTYINSLKAMFDTDLAQVCGFIVIARGHKNPEVRDLFVALELLDMISNSEFRNAFEIYLEHMPQEKID